MKKEKLYLGILITFLWLSVPILGIAQNQKVTLTENVISLKSAFDQIEKQTGLSVDFDARMIDLNKIAKLTKTTGNVKEIMSLLLKDSDLSFSVNGTHIIISAPDRNKSSKSKTVSGVVKDANGQPLIGVNVLIKGSGKGAITDLDGKYKIEAAEGTHLQFTYIGYLPLDVRVGASSNIPVTLREDNKALDEVVVVGYGTVARSNLTTSVASVKMDKIPSAANSNVNELLFGRAAGLKATQQSAEPGGLVSLSIRGGGDPLVVVDGVVLPTNSLNSGSLGIGTNNVNRGGIGNINPADIESVEVLKDASAAIYGVAAANGVILITTKKGAQGDVKVSYDGSISSVQNMPYMKAMTPSQGMTAYNEYSNDYYLANKKMAPFGSNAATGFTPYFSQGDINSVSGSKGTDWIGLVTRSGSVSNHNININGATNKVKYYFSGNYFDQMGTVKGSGFKRFMGTINLSFNLNKYLEFTTFTTASRNFYENGSAGYQPSGAGGASYGALQSAISYPTYLPVKTSDGSYSLFNAIGNPVSLLSISDQSKSSSFLSNFSLNLTLIPKVLNVKLLYGNNYQTAGRSQFVPSDVYWGLLYQSRGMISQDESQNQTFEGTVSFAKKFNNLNFDAVAGAGKYINDTNGSGLYATDMLDAMQTYNMGAAPTLKQMSSYKSYEQRRSFFTRLNFNYLDKYLLSLSYRMDGIDKFYTGNKYAGFPSVSLGWKLNQEDFLKQNEGISLLKLRGSVGVTGMAIGSVAYGQYKSSYTLYFDEGATSYSAYYLSSMNQPNLKWQKTLNENVGLDFGFFNNRISGAVDYFHNEITNLLTTRTTEQLAMNASQYENGGKQVNSGYEIALKTVNIATKTFEWDMTTNVSHYYNHWTKRFPNQSLSAYVGVTDGISDVYAYKTNGILQVGETPSAWQPAKAQLPGCPKFVDANGDGVLDYKDVKRYSTAPKLTLGWGNNFKYKNLDFSMFFYAQLGAWGFNNSYGWSNARSFAGGNGGGAVAYVLNSWSTANTKGTLPGAAYDESTLGLNAASDVTLERKDFVRCREISLGYTFKQNFVQKFAKDIRLYVNVQNPFIITNYSISDPEVSVASVKGGAAPYPMTRTYSVGLNVHF